MPSSPISRPPKRSASAASLPTPPRTNRRRKNGKLRSLKAAAVQEEEEEQEGGGAASSDEEGEGAGQGKYKKRRISSIAEGKEEEDEDAFWMAGASPSNKGKSKETEVDTDSDSDSETTTSFLSRRVQRSSTMGSAPVSPPPSHRRLPGAKIATTPVMKLLPVIAEDVSPSGTSPPETPKSSKTRAMRDSPSNPFLASPLDLGDTASSSASPKTPKESHKERPTITYVFRGVKKTYPNPYYDHENDRPRSPDPNSLLPPEHEDYTPDLRGAPRALWPKKMKGPPAPLASPESPTRAHRRKKVVQLADSDHELDAQGVGDEDEISLRPVRLFAPGARRPGVATRF